MDTTQMKKLSAKRHKWLLRRAAAQRRRRRRRLQPLAALARTLSPPNGKLAQGYRFARTLRRFQFPGTKPWNYVLQAPTDLHFGTQHDKVAVFTAGIRKLFGASLHPFLDFTQVELAAPAAALYVAAEVDRWRNQRSAWARPRVYDFHEWHPPIRRYFRDLGLFELLQVANPPDDPPSVSQTRVLRMRRNHILDPDSVTLLRDELHALCGSVPNRLSFFDALCEAMNNVIHHAYQDPDPEEWPRIQNGWWMTADFDPLNHMLRIAFLDQGVGIPARLPRSGFSELIDGLLRRLGRNDDAARIEAALQYGRSSTGKSNRGKGFHDMQLFVDGGPHNWMRVLSGFGECVYRDGSWYSTQHAEPVVGTIVEWSLVVLPEG
jgi:hypothetical protein